MSTPALCDKCGVEVMTPDAFDALRQRAEYAESRLASISGVTRQALVERAVRVTIEAAAEYIKADRDQNEHTMSDPCWNGMTSAMELVTELKTAPIVARVLGGGE